MDKQEQLEKAYFQCTHFIKAMKKYPVGGEEIDEGLNFILAKFPLVDKKELAQRMKQ